MKIICRKHEGLINVPELNELKDLNFRFNAYVFHCPVCDHQLIISNIQRDMILEKRQVRGKIALASGW